MSKPWLLIILLLSLGLMLCQKSEEILHLQSFFPYQKVLKLKHFKEAGSTLNSADQDLLELWESMLTGNTRPLNMIMKENFSRLGLRHLFTPSGLHLGALLYPSLKILKSFRQQIILLTLLGIFFFPLTGFVALKRMIAIKWVQKLIGPKKGFVSALLLDVLFGGFQTHTLSFTYSFLFLGIMYSGVKGMGRVFWFFIAQCFIAFSQAAFIAPLLIIFSPLLSFIFVLVLPILFLLSFPLWDWQLQIGLSILQTLLRFISLSAEISTLIPSWEMHAGMILLLGLLVLRSWKGLSLIVLLLSSSLNLDLNKNPSAGTYDWVPVGKVLRVEERETKTVIQFSDGRCERVLVRGFWWEKCSPRRRSRKIIRKLSYPSSELRRSSLRG